MTTTELLNIFSTFTREDWINFDNIKNIVFQPTQAEINLQIQEQELNRINTINSKLANLGITRPEIITKEFVLGLLTSMNAKQFIGEDFNGWIDNQTLLFGSLETAFDDLVIRFL